MWGKDLVAQQEKACTSGALVRLLGIATTFLVGARVFGCPKGTTKGV